MIHRWYGDHNLEEKKVNHGQKMSFKIRGSIFSFFLKKKSRMTKIVFKQKKKYLEEILALGGSPSENHLSFWGKLYSAQVRQVLHHVQIDFYHWINKSHFKVK
jgi:hypothetical protein